MFPGQSGNSVATFISSEHDAGCGSGAWMSNAASPCRRRRTGRASRGTGRTPRSAAGPGRGGRRGHAAHRQEPPDRPELFDHRLVMAPALAKANLNSPNPIAPTTIRLEIAQCGIFAVSRTSRIRPTVGRGRTAGARRRCRRAPPRSLLASLEPAFASAPRRAELADPPWETAFANSPTENAEDTSRIARMRRRDRLLDDRLARRTLESHREQVEPDRDDDPLQRRRRRRATAASRGRATTGARPGGGRATDNPTAIRVAGTSRKPPVDLREPLGDVVPRVAFLATRARGPRAQPAAAAARRDQLRRRVGQRIRIPRRDDAAVSSVMTPRYPVMSEATTGVAQATDRRPGSRSFPPPSQGAPRAPSRSAVGGEVLR